MGINYYDELQVSRSATIDEINQQYRKLSLKYHPDKLDKSLPKDVLDEFIEKFKVINIAVQVLRCKAARAKYDEELERKSSSHSYFDCFSSNTRSEDTPVAFRRESPAEEYYYCLLIASKYDPTLLEQVLVDTTPTGPQIQAMKRYIHDVEAARIIRQKHRKAVEDGINQLRMERSSTRKSKEKKKENTQEYYASDESDIDAGINSETSGICDTLSDADNPIDFSSANNLSSSDKEIKEDTEYSITKGADKICQTELSLINLSEKYSSIMDALLMSIACESEQLNTSQIYGTNTGLGYAHKQGQASQSSSINTSIPNISADICGVEIPVSLSVKKPQSKKKRKSEADNLLSKKTEHKKKKANRRDDESIKYPQKIKQPKTVFASKLKKKTSKKTLPTKTEFVGTKDCQNHDTLQPPREENIRKYVPTLKNPNQYFFHYWVYADGECIDTKEQRDITDLHIYSSNGKHTCQLNNEYHTHTNEVSSTLKRSIELHLQPSLFTFICAHCCKKFNVVTNLINHMKSHIKDIN